MFKLIDKDSNYYAQIVFLNEGKKHENASSLYIWNVNNYNVITDLSYTKGQTCVFFPVECQINPLILSYLNMYEDKTLNQDKEKKGYIHPKGRVRAVKLRGEVSDGLLIDFGVFVKALNYCGANIGMIGIGANEPPFDHYGDIWICKKYIPIIKEARNSGTGAKVKGPKLHDFLVDGQFQFHGNTPKLQDNVHKIQPNTWIVKSYKYHGTSAVFSNVLTKRKLSILERVFKFFGRKVVEQEYSKMYSSRTVLKSIEGKYHTKEQGFYNTDIWGTVFEEVKDKLEIGITLYGEIVGFTPSGSAIQGGYDYGCIPYTPDDLDIPHSPQHRFLVYRITHTDSKGHVREFTQNDIYVYCRDNDIESVGDLYEGTAGEYYNNRNGLPFDESFTQENFSYEFFNLLKEEVENLGNCRYCKNKVPAEGYVIRTEDDDTGKIEWFKLKASSFLLKESQQLDKEEVDIESEN